MKFAAIVVATLMVFALAVFNHHNKTEQHITPEQAVASMVECNASITQDCYVITRTGDLFVL